MVRVSFNLATGINQLKCRARASVGEHLNYILQLPENWQPPDHPLRKTSLLSHSKWKYPLDSPSNLLFLFLLARGSSSVFRCSLSVGSAAALAAHCIIQTSPSCPSSSNRWGGHWCVAPWVGEWQNTDSYSHVSSSGRVQFIYAMAGHSCFSTLSAFLLVCVGVAMHFCGGIITFNPLPSTTVEDLNFLQLGSPIKVPKCWH